MGLRTERDKAVRAAMDMTTAAGKALTVTKQHQAETARLRRLLKFHRIMNGVAIAVAALAVWRLFA